jgi:raffinose/stachyose/melibiose transport system substrate-binding protein
MIKWLRNSAALLVVAGAYVWSVAVIASYRAKESPPGTITLRIGHWQLESGVRQAFHELAAEYQKLHPNVRVVQDAIPETTYGQWVTTQLMGGTAPDIMEVGLGLPGAIWLGYFKRYFVPLTAWVNEPNPYNAGTELEGVPLRQTYLDGMRAAYVPEIQEYMSIPLAQFGLRVMYNRDLLEQVTGRREAPTELREFLRVCEQIRAHGLDPIAASRYHFWMWAGKVFDMVTYPAIRQADFNRDGLLGNDEAFAAFRAGLLSMEYPPYRARFELLREVSDYFQTGYTGLTRDEAVFLFAQQRAVFLASGTWDYQGLVDQARGKFEVGIMEFPRPTPEDPKYGRFVEGPVYEEVQSVGFPFGVTRTSRHPEQAVDFLLFLASQRQNERLNRIIGWIPAIVGADMEPALRAFAPQLEGVYSAMPLMLGGETTIKWQQLMALYQIRQIDYDALAREYEQFYRERGLLDFLEARRDWRRALANNEQFLGGVRAQALLAADPATAAAWWLKYRTLTLERQLLPEINRARQLRLVEQGPAGGATPPYEYSAAVIEKVRAELRR